MATTSHFRYNLIHAPTQSKMSIGQPDVNRDMKKNDYKKINDLQGDIEFWEEKYKTCYQYLHLKPREIRATQNRKWKANLLLLSKLHYTRRASQFMVFPLTLEPLFWVHLSLLPVMIYWPWKPNRWINTRRLSFCNVDGHFEEYQSQYSGSISTRNSSLLKLIHPLRPLGGCRPWCGVGGDPDYVGFKWSRPSHFQMFGKLMN